MVKAPSSHGLDRKFKPWRRGKSQNSNKRSSLKQQLRGYERLLKRSTDDAHKQTLLQKIEELKQEIANKEVIERERKNAKQSHGSRFLERQKLVRMQHNAQKEQNSEQLDRISLDQIYVGHFPLDTKYLCLFRNGQRRTDPLKVLSQRAKIRDRILFQQLASTEHKDWISKDQYARVGAITKKISSWTAQEERTYFGQEDNISSKNEVAPKDDSRFTVAPQHEAVLEAAKQIEKQMDEDDDDLDSSEAEEDSPDSESETDPLQTVEKGPKGTEGGNTTTPPPFHSDYKKNESASESNSDDSSTSSSSTDESITSQAEKLNQVAPSENTNTDPAPVADEDSGDDFLVAVDDSKGSEENPFSNQRQQVEPFVSFTGDKSKGWTTQKQRPGQWQGQKDRVGQFKKRRGNNK